MGKFLRDVMKLNLEARNFRLFSPDENNSNRWQDVLEVTNRAWIAEILPVRRPPRARRPGDGDAERAPVPGLARGLPAHRPARLLLLLRGVHPHHRLDVQPARQVAEGVQPHPLAAADRLAELPAVAATSGGRTTTASATRIPGFIDHVVNKKAEVDPRLPAARRQLPALGHRPLPAQPQLRQRRRRRQAAGAAVADDGRGDQALHGRASASGSGPATTRAASPTW